MRFATDGEVRAAVLKVLRAIPAEEFEKIMTPKWQEQMQECVINSGKYFEKVPVDGNVPDIDSNLFQIKFFF